MYNESYRDRGSQQKQRKVYLGLLSFSFHTRRFTSLVHLRSLKEFSLSLVFSASLTPLGEVSRWDLRRFDRVKEVYNYSIVVCPSRCNELIPVIIISIEIRYDFILPLAILVGNRKLFNISKKYFIKS